MFRIEPFQPADLPCIIGFVGAIQDYERSEFLELKPGAEIAGVHAATILRHVTDCNGQILMAKDGEQTIGFVCAWIERDEDALLWEEARSHAYVSDIFVEAEWRRRGVAQALLREIETAMRAPGCMRMRICAKAGNTAALGCYQSAGYRPYEVILRKAIS